MDERLTDITYMKSSHSFCVICLMSLFLALPASAKDKGKKDANSSAGGGGLKASARTPQNGKEPWVGVNVSFSGDERKVIQDYAHECQTPPAKGKKARGLPPGLAKKVARGGELPPGWQKKCVKGEVMPEPVYRQCHPLPQEVVVKLPPPPPETNVVAISGKVVRLARATREILDVFDVKF
jgi:hypothetical protein